MDNSPKYLFKIGQLEASLNDLADDDIFLKERDPKKREQYIKNIIDTSTKAAEDYASRINLKENTMKKSELKMLIKDLIKEIYNPDDYYDIETSKGKFRLTWQDDSDSDSTGALYWVTGPDGKFYSVDSNATSLKDIKQWIETSNKIPHNTMKKSELKELLKVIAEEVIAIKKSKLDENKGLSGFKKAKESTDHTENVADSKSLTPTSEPKEKKEGKKLPVVKKPANPQTVGSIKEEIIKMIREEIDEMARVKGAVGSKFKVEDPSSPTGWVVKGHKTIPDGTPTEAPKGPYQPKGVPGMGRPKASVGNDGDEGGEEDGDVSSVTSSVPSKISVTFDGDDVGEIDMNKVKGPLMAHLKTLLGGELSLYKIDSSLQAKLDAYSDMYVDDKLPAGAKLTLQVVGDTVKAI